MALVYDQFPAGSLRVFRRASDGALLAEGDTNREGIYLYPAEDGSGRMIRELRTADTVQRMTAKVARAVVTMGHPEEPITPDNVQTLSHGDVDGGFDIVDQGGFVRGRNRVALRSREAVTRAERGELKGFSPGYTPVRDNTPGVDPKWGAYDRTLIDIADDAANHLALCGDSDDLPPARGGNHICGLYLDSQPVQRTKGAPMKRPGSAPEWRHFFSQDAVKARLHAIRPGLKPNAKDAAGKDIAKDALNLEELAAEVQAAMADPESLSAILVHAIVNKPAEVEEIKMGTEEPMDGYPMAAMDAKIKAATDALEARFAPRLAELDALKAKEAARDAHATAQNDAELRRLSAFHGVRDAGTLAIPALVTALGERLNLAIDGTGDPRPFVQGTAARRAASMGPVLPVVAYDATQDADLKPNTTEVQ